MQEYTSMLINLVIAFIFGFFNAQISQLIIFSFGYGHILWKQRIKRFGSFIDSKNKKDKDKIAYHSFYKEINEAINLSDWNEANAQIDRVLLVVCKSYNSLLLWLCPMCLSVRLVVFTIAGYILTTGEYRAEYIVLIIGTSLYYVKK